MLLNLHAFYYYYFWLGLSQRTSEYTFTFFQISDSFWIETNSALLCHDLIQLLSSLQNLFCSPYRDSLFCLDSAYTYFVDLFDIDKNGRS